MTAVATTTQVADLTRAVAGDRAGVRQILQPNSDPHEYEPRPSDVKQVAGADVVLRSGGDLDSWLDGVLRNAGSDARIVTLIDAMTALSKEMGMMVVAEGVETAEERDVIAEIGCDLMQGYLFARPSKGFNSVVW